MAFVVTVTVRKYTCSIQNVCVNDSANRTQQILVSRRRLGTSCRAGNGFSDVQLLHREPLIDRTLCKAETPLIAPTRQPLSFINAR